jgi:hypothetical protein
VLVFAMNWPDEGKPVVEATVTVQGAPLVQVVTLVVRLVVV